MKRKPVIRGIVYRILCVPNGMVYIGSTRHSYGYQSRWSTHVSCLNKGTHHTPMLQNDWLQYGKECFEFSILETCATADVIAKEQKWMDCAVKIGVRLYNVSLIAGGSNVGMKRTKEQKAHMSAWQKGIPKGPNPRSVNAKISRSLGGGTVLCLTSGCLFDSCADVANRLDVNGSNVAQVCRGFRASAGKMRFTRVSI